MESCWMTKASPQAARSVRALLLLVAGLDAVRQRREKLAQTRDLPLQQVERLQQRRWRGLLQADATLESERECHPQFGCGCDSSV